ncbi:TetR/AcrR family transcriptional regulator [Kocuria nitroreducens]|uniref:TetR/AcrR family transcriptional regulator n=1 Tax=Kocuria nitroreducens TaxID=3058914 RepID=UPI0036D9A279
MPRTRDTYHHGDLRRALVDAGLAATRGRGATALGLREVTRQVGVSPNAAYRHFADRQALLFAVAREIQDRMAEQMRARMPAPGDIAPRDRARLRLRAVGLGYIAFAVAEPGWFETAFFGPGGEPEGVLRDAHDRLPPPFALLVEGLDGLVEAGGLSRERREGAEWACWSAVHGFAELVVHGPLRGQRPEQIDRWAERVVDDIISGIA